MGLTTKEWLAEFNGHSIRVVNTWFSGAKLYIDGNCRDTNSEYFTVDRNRPLLSARVENPGGELMIVEVYLVAWLTTNAKICVNGRQIGGDVF